MSTNQFISAPYFLGVRILGCNILKVTIKEEVVEIHLDFIRLIHLGLDVEETSSGSEG
jgi:hypothetical protein